MNTKLTLTIEQSVIRRAKKYASQKGRSLSNIVENFLKNITSEEIVPDKEISPLTKSLKGSFKLPSDFEYKKELKKALSDKYL